MPPPYVFEFYFHPLYCCHFLLCPPLIFQPPPPLQVIIAQSPRRRPSLGATDLRKGESVFVGKKDLFTICALENNSKGKEAVEFIDASLHLFCEDSAL